MQLKKLIIISSITMMITGTTVKNTAHAGENHLLGTLLGAAGGAAVGSNIGKGKGRIAAIAVGTLLGASVGNHVVNGHHKKRYNRHYKDYDRYFTTPVYGQTDYVVPNYQYATYNTQPGTIYNRTAIAVNASTTTQPYCREFTQTVNVGGKPQESYGTACRKPDGAWEIQN